MDNNYYCKGIYEIQDIKTASESIDRIKVRSILTSFLDSIYYAKGIYHYRSSECKQPPILTCDFRDIETCIKKSTTVYIYPAFTAESLCEILHQIAGAVTSKNIVFLTMILSSHHGPCDESIMPYNLAELFDAEKVFLNLWYSNNEDSPYTASVMAMDGIKTFHWATEAIRKALADSRFEGKFSMNGKYTFRIDNYDVDGVMAYTFRNKMSVFPDQGNPNQITISQELIELSHDLSSEDIDDCMARINTEVNGVRFEIPFLYHEAPDVNRIVLIIKDIEAGTEDNLVKILPEAIVDTIRAASYFVNVQSVELR